VITQEQVRQWDRYVVPQNVFRIGKYMLVLQQPVLTAVAWIEQSAAEAYGFD